jgi:hypothetical protein
MDEPRDASVEEMTFKLAEVAHTDDRRMMMGSSPEIVEGSQTRIPGDGRAVETAPGAKLSS